MELNVQKCAVLSFSRSQDVIRFEYTLDGLALKHVTSIRDFVVVVNTRLSPHDHVSHICNKAIARRSYMDAPVAELRRSLNLATLQERRRTADLIFLYKIVNGDTDCLERTELLDYRVPRGTRLRDVFGRVIQNTRYSYMSSIPRVLREGNLLDNSIFESSCDGFRHSAK
ncbi:hypothetical protein J6590_019555 [Homalodisca vitripennis]|nr:hypothetical protein J6590_019555 [Homalodisca vitripennis]